VQTQDIAVKEDSRVWWDRLPANFWSAIQSTAQCRSHMRWSSSI